MYLSFCSLGQAFELASHFMTFAGGDLSKVGRNEFVPAREFQLRWCHCYLMGYKNLKENQVFTYTNFFFC